VNRINQAARLARSLRRVKAVWQVIYTRQHPTSVAAATVSTKRVWAAVGGALAAGATDAQIHKAMDDAYIARRPCRFRLRSAQ